MLSGIYGGVESLQAMTIGGVGPDGRDVTNEMTYLVLETAETMRTLEPSLVLRYHDGTPDRLLTRRRKSFERGSVIHLSSMTRALIPTLQGWGVPWRRPGTTRLPAAFIWRFPGRTLPAGPWERWFFPNACGGLSIRGSIRKRKNRGAPPRRIPQHFEMLMI